MLILVDSVSHDVHPEYHRDESLHHATKAQQAMEVLQESDRASETTRKALHQRIGVNLKLADVHARLAVTAALVATAPEAGTT